MGLAEKRRGVGVLGELPGIKWMGEGGGSTLC